MAGKEIVGNPSVCHCIRITFLEGMRYTFDISIKGFLSDIDNKKSTDDATKCSCSNPL